MLAYTTLADIALASSVRAPNATAPAKYTIVCRGSGRLIVMRQSR